MALPKYHNFQLQFVFSHGSFAVPFRIQQGLCLHARLDAAVVLLCWPVASSIIKENTSRARPSNLRNDDLLLLGVVSVVT